MALGILLVRRHVPESPRWLAMHGRNEEAERVVAGIEEHVKEVTDRNELPEATDEIELRPRKSTGFGEIARTMFGRYPRRSVLGFTLMSTQAFIYNATVFTFTAGAVRDRQLPRRPAARPLLRHDRQTADDRGDVLHLGGRAGRRRNPVQERLGLGRRVRWRSCAPRSSSPPRPPPPAT
jgi:hypothetical protein